MHDTCDVKECTNDPAYHAEVVIYARVAHLHTPAIGYMPIRVCHEHATDQYARELLTEPGKRQIEDGFKRAGKALPDWSRSHVRWIEDPDPADPREIDGMRGN